MRIATLVLAATAVAGALTMGAVLAGEKFEPKPIVSLPKTWDAAVEEAKTLNLPIVVHSHGFY
jgi:hypothetical protein